MSDQGRFGIVAGWAGRAVVVEILKETDKTITAADLKEDGTHLWRAQRHRRGDLLRRFANAAEAFAVANRATAAFDSFGDAINAAQAELRRLENARRDAWREALDQ